MKLTTAVFAALLSIASAVPQPQVIDLGDGVKLIPRKPRRHRHSRPKLPTSEASIKAITNNTHAEYSTNWAGAILPGSYNSSSTEYAASAWVGIDGYTCSQPIIQTGIDVYVQGGAVHYDAWYEWWPALAYSFDGFSVGTGDSVTMTVTASSSSAGTVTLKNNSKGKTVTHSFSGEAVKLCQAEAEWIIEDFQLQGQLVPFANFGTVSFTGASATGSDGCAVGVSGSRVINLKKDNKVLTSCSTSGPNTFKCSYVS